MVLILSNKYSNTTTIATIKTTISGRKPLKCFGSGGGRTVAGQEVYGSSLPRNTCKYPISPSINLSTEKALEETMLSPRFYTTDFAAIDKISIEGVREEWDKLMSEFEKDSNIDHFQRPKDMQENYSRISPEVDDEFVDFLKPYHRV